MNHQPNTPASLNEAVATPTPSDKVMEWQFVPKEATHEMIAAMAKAWQEAVVRDDPHECVAEWRAALLAAPGAAIDARERRITEAEAGTALIRAMDDLRLNKSLRADIVAAYVRHIAALASRQEAPAASAQAAVDAIAAFAPKIEDSVHGRRWRCQQCGHAWMPSEKEHHATNCAYVIATSVPHAAPSRATPSEALSPATVAQPVGDEDDKRNARGTSFRVEDLKLPLPALPEPFIASTEIGYSLHRAPEVLRFGADCYRLAQAAHPCASQGCVGAELCQAAEEAIQWLNIWFRNHDGNKVADKLRAALSKNN